MACVVSSYNNPQCFLVEKYDLVFFSKVSLSCIWFSGRPKWCVFLEQTSRCVFWGRKVAWTCFFDRETCLGVFFHTFELFDTMHAINKRQKNVSDRRAGRNNTMTRLCHEPNVTCGLFQVSVFWCRRLLLSYRDRNMIYWLRKLMLLHSDYGILVLLCRTGKRSSLGSGPLRDWGK